MPAFKQYIESEIQQRNLKPECLYANKGDLLIWHSQLFHGGSKIVDKTKTRKSLVTHYFTSEDFPDFCPTPVGDLGTYMDRPAQTVNYDFEPKKWFEKLLG